MGDNDNGHESASDRKEPKRTSKVRDLFTDRIVGIVGGAFIPVILLFLPLLNKYLDNSKEIQTLQIQSNTRDINMLIAEVKKISNELEECHKNCEPYCASLKKGNAL